MSGEDPYTKLFTVRHSPWIGCTTSIGMEWNDDDGDGAGADADADDDHHHDKHR